MISNRAELHLVDADILEHDDSDNPIDMAVPAHKIKYPRSTARNNPEGLSEGQLKM